MVFFIVLGLMLLMGVAGRRPNRASYAVVACAAIVVSVYEYLQ